MTDNEKTSASAFTDNEIIKALECCIKGNTSDVCVDCPLRTTDICTEEENGVLKLALDLINRQKAEIERLQKENEILSANADNAFQEGLNESRELFKQEVEAQIKAEAVKEFAKRVKIQMTFGRYLHFEQIDNIKKEMVGEG